MVVIQTKFATPEDKEALARGFASSGKPGTGSVDGDIIAFSSEIAKCVQPISQQWRKLTRCGTRSLIESLGLTTRLRDYNIPREDIPRIVERTIGKSSGELYDQVTGIMEGAF